MSLAIVFESIGDHTVLHPKEVHDRPPNKNEVQIKQTAIEVNYIDIYHRKGIYPLDTKIKVPGVSAVGTISAIGDEVKGFSIGQRVGYATSKNGGAYCQQRCIDASLVFNIPDDITDHIAASCLVKALTAHYLSHRVYIVRQGFAVLIHAAAGGVGQLLSQWCNSMGAFVVGTVGSDEKIKIAKENGCHHAINYNNPEWLSQVMHVTKGFGFHAVYDSVGKATFEKSLQSLVPMGIMVSYGGSSGAVESVDMSLIGEKSLFITRPTLFDYKKGRMELVLSAQEVFANIADGTLRPNIYAEMPLEQASEAHKLLESRAATGSIILIP